MLKVVIFVLVTMCAFVCAEGMILAQTTERDCALRFATVGFDANAPRAYAQALQGLSPADELRIREVIKDLESKGVSRAVILKELHQGSKCGL